MQVTPFGLTRARWLLIPIAVLEMAGGRFAASAAEPVRCTILVSPGRFADVETAAAGEAQVTWRDKDLTDDDACTECFAAVELRRFLARCTTLDEKAIRLAPPKSLPDRGHVFVLGSKRSNPLMASVKAPAGKRVAPRGPESYCIRAFQQGGRIVVKIEGYDRVGTLYGVYAYLHVLGMRFYGLGEQGTVYPAGPVPLPEDLNVVEGPDYITRGFWPWLVNADKDFYLWMARNRLNLWTPEEGRVPLMRKLGLRLFHGCHIMHYVCLNPKHAYPYDHPKFEGDQDKPKDPYRPSPEYQGDVDKDGKLSYFEAHPEWYGLQGGKRSARIGTDGGDNYCTSNKDATHELAKNLIREFREGQWRDVDVYNFAMLDNGRWCTCEACKKQGTFTDRLFKVLHTIRREMDQARQEGRLGHNVQFLPAAYHETLPTPSKPLPADFDYENCFIALYPIERTYAYPFADPASTKVNRHLLERYEKWVKGDDRTYKGSMAIGEYYNVSSHMSMPLVFTRVMAADIPWYHHTGTRHFFYMHTPLRLWGTWTLNQHLMARLLWDVGADAEAIVAEYLARFYPTTTTYAKAFYEHLETASRNIKAFKHYTWGYSLRSRLRGAIRDKSAKLFTREDLQYFPNHPEVNDGPDVVEIIDAVRKARQAIDDALLTCTDPREQARLLEDERRFAYGEAMFLFYYHMIRTVMFHQRGDGRLARHEFASLDRMAKRLEQVTELVQVAGEHANAANGLVASQVVTVYDVLKKHYRVDRSAPPKVVGVLTSDKPRIEIVGSDFQGSGRQLFPKTEILGSAAANWVYGQESGADSMTTAYRLAAGLRGAKLIIEYATLAGKDDGAPVPIRIDIADTVVFAGMPEPAPKAFRTLEIPIPARLLTEGTYVLRIQNLEPRGGLNSRPWLAVRRVVVAASS